MKWLFLVLSISVFKASMAQRSCLIPDKSNPNFVNWTNVLKKNHGHSLEVRETITLPLVIHLVYEDENSNISDAQIFSQIDALNLDFTGKGGSFQNIPNLFRPFVGTPNVRFCLARIDPDGKTTIGITRTQTTIPNAGITTTQDQRYLVHYDQYGGKTGWDPSRYINIWIADMGGLFGRATLPGTANYPEEDGIVIDPIYFGTIQQVSPPYDLGRTLVHEMGHYLGLLHIWGNQENECDEDDLIADTPLQSNAYTGCPQFPQISCNSQDMFMNFMDLTTDRCYTFFTKDQVTVMHRTLNMERNSLMNQPTNCFQPNPRPNFENIQIYYLASSQRIVVMINPISLLGNYSLGIFNLSGQAIYQVMNLENNFTFTFDRILPTGIYFVTLNLEGNLYTKKLFIK